MLPFPRAPYVSGYTIVGLLNPVPPLEGGRGGLKLALPLTLKARPVADGLVKDPAIPVFPLPVRVAARLVPLPVVVPCMVRAVLFANVGHNHDWANPPLLIELVAVAAVRPDRADPPPPPPPQPVQVPVTLRLLIVADDEVRFPVMLTAPLK